MEKQKSKQAPKVLNRLEKAFKDEFETLLFNNNRTKFTKVLPALREDLPADKSSKEYQSINRSEYLKLTRASFSFKEVKDMLDVLDYGIVFRSSEGKLIFPVKYALDDDIKVKYTEIMATCELFGISIKWEKYAGE